LAPDFQELDPWKRNALHLAGKPIGFPIDIPKQAGFILAGTAGLIPDGPDASKASKELLGRFSVDSKVVPPSYVCWFINHSSIYLPQ